MIRTAVILAAGWGTRLLPATKALPKEMLPLVDKPLIQYSVEEAVASGLERIVLVTARGKGIMEDYFDKAPELESLLERRGDKHILEQVRRPTELGSISYVRQKEQLGIGHAILSARHAIGEEPFALLFPDDVIEHPVPVIKQMLEVQRKYGGNVIAVERVPRSQVQNYGIVSGKPVGDRVLQVSGLIEKPSPESAPSDLAIVGRYVLSPHIYKVLENTPPGAKGEIQVTDGLQRLLEQEPVYAYEFEGNRYDTGNILGLLKASVSLGLKHPDFATDFREFLRSLDLRGSE